MKYEKKQISVPRCYRVSVFTLHPSWPIKGEVPMAKSIGPFNVLETTIDDIHSAYKSGQLTSHQLVQMYLDRIEAYDKK